MIPFTRTPSIRVLGFCCGLLLSSLPARAADVTLSYAVADSGDTLVSMNRFTGLGFTVIGNTGTSNIEAIAWNIGATVLYATNAGQFGALNPATGVFTPVGTGIGTGNGARGPINLNDIDGLTMDPLTGILYGSHRDVDGSPDDVLIQINPTSGAFIPNAFGPGVDYVVINTSSLSPPVTPTIYDVDDIAVDPLNGQMYGVANTGGGGDRLVKINKFTGVVTDVARLQLADTTGVDDVEGFSFFNDGTFYATTGNSGAAATNDRLWQVNTTTAVMTLIGAFGSGNDYEAVGDLTAPANSIAGTVFKDVQLDGIYAGPDTPTSGVSVKLYLDVNDDGMLDGGDVLIQTKVTGAGGTYQFLLGAEGNFIVEVDQSTLPPSFTGISTPEIYSVVFLAFGNSSTGNDFGWFDVGAIGDTIFWDLDKNGTQDPGEPGIPGVDVTVDTPTMGQVTVTTNEFGNYFFQIQETGSHTVTVDTGTLPFPFPQTADPDATLDNATTVSVVLTSDVILTADFGYEFRYLDKQFDKALASDGDTINYTLFPRYQFEDPLTSVVVTDDLPAGTTFVSAGQGGTHDAGSPGTVTWNLGSNLAGAPGIITGTSASVQLFADRDTFLDENKPTDINGSLVELKNKNDTAKRERSLLHFNVAGAGIPVGSKIDSATMSLWVTTEKTTTIGIHRLTRNWTEGGANWNTNGLTGWTAPGAEGNYVAAAEITFQPLVKDVYVNSGVNALAKFWFENPASNFGVILRSDNNQEAKFSAREAAGTAQDPKLVINYTTPTLTNTIVKSPSLGVTGDTVTVTMTLTSNVDMTGVAPTLNVNGTNNMGASLVSGPTPASQNITAGTSVQFNWVYTVTEGAGASPGQLWFDGDATGTTGSGPLSFANAASNRAIATPPLSFQVTVDGGAASPLANTGQIESTDAGGPFIPLTDSNTVTTLLTPAVIGNRVWLDEDGDGVQDAGEDGIGGVTVELLDDLLVVIDTAVTDSEGGYLFTGLTGGNYTVRVDTATLPAGLAANQTGDPDASFDDEHAVAVVAGDEMLLADFGYNWVPAADTTSPGLGATGAIGDRLWIDADGDGAQDAGEAGIPGVTVELYTDPDGDGIYSNLAGTTATDDTGHYIFDGLSPTAYVVQVVTGTLPAGYTQTGDPDSTIDHKTDPLPLGPGDVIVSADFGYQPASGSDIGDTIYFDADADSTQDGGEPGIAGVTVALLDASGDPIAMMVTDASGNYLFPGLPAGTYTVAIADTENILSDLASTQDPDGGADRQSTLAVDGTSDNLAQDFGFTPPGHASGEGLVGDTVFLDRDADGTPDAGEGLEGVRVDLFDIGGTVLIASARTDENGRYAFGDLDPNATYTVRVNAPDLPAGVTNTVDPDAGTAGESVVDLSAGGGVDLDQDFGYRDLSSPNAIGGTVWGDTDADGTLDESGTGIAGVKIVLRDSGGSIVGTTTTDGSGVYLFSNLPDGSYTVGVADESNRVAGAWKSTGPSPGADNNSQLDPYPVTVSGGQTDTTGDFGFYEEPAAVGNFVFNDIDQDGLQDGGEPGIAGAVVRLTITYPSGDAVTLTTTTDASGIYTFGNLLVDENYDGVGTPLVDEPQWVVTMVAPPPGGTASPSNVGGDDTVDSDDGAAGEAAEPLQGGADDTNDFGFYGVKLQKNYANWTGFFGLTGPDAVPSANSDGDLYSNLIEYAFCLDPTTGIDSDKNFCVAESLTMPGQLDAFFTRAAGLTDLTYTLEGIADLSASPGGWADTGIVPTVVDNGDGTETVTYEDLESVPALSGGTGFVRVKVDLSSPVATAVTEVFGWERNTIQAQCETWSQPFLKKPTFSGTVDSMTGSDLEVATSAGTGDVGAALAAGVEYYVEVIGGAEEGHRFDVDEAGTDADTVAIDAGSAHNTQSPVPDLSGAVFILRAHDMLDGLFDKTAFAGDGDPDVADRLLFRFGGSWTVFYLLDSPLQWTQQGEAGMPDRGDRIVDPCEGIFLHPRAASVDLVGVGMVRANDFACPLSQGYNFIRGGWPLDQSPADRDMTLADGFFFGGTDPAAVDQAHFWKGDAVLNASGYSGYWLLDAGPPFEYWTGMNDPAVTDEDATPLFLRNRSAQINVTSDRLNYELPLPWVP